MTKTNGFLFIGIFSSSFVGNLTEEQLKGGKTSFDFSGYEQVFCFQDKAQTIAISSLPVGKYSYSYLATNENIKTLTYTTGVLNGSEFKIEDSAIFGQMLSLNILVILLMLILMR